MVNKIKLLWFVALLLSFSSELFAQQQEAYTFCTGGSYAYLLDTATTSTSTYYKRWTIGTTAYTAHMSKDTIYQTTGTSGLPGGYGTIKKYAWDGSVTWTYAVTNAHHDICPMPNGNVLIFVRETKTAAAVQAIGGSTSSSIAFDIIREIHPTGATTGTVVWEWKLWDHLCQSVNSSYPNYYSNVANAPQLWNINCNLQSDGFHPNGIDYNPTLDQIVFSSHNNDELYVIDHSTTTAQAATHAGGNAGKGGDFIWRWGKPQNYNCTTNGNGITLNVIHDARWVPASNSKWPNYISIYHNNGGAAVQCVLHLPDYNGYSYNYTPGSVIGTNTPVLPAVPSITGVNSQGGAMVCDNGNVIITKPNNYFKETNGVSITALQSVTVSTVQADRMKLCDVRYPTAAATVTPATVCANTAVTLGSSATSITETSPTYTYSWASVPAGFSSTAQNPTATPSTAGSYTYTVTVTNNVGCTSTAAVNVTVNTCTDVEENTIEKTELIIYPNPTTGIINLNEEFILNNDFEIWVCNSFGKIIFKAENNGVVDLSAFANGVYYLTVVTEGRNAVNRKVILMR